MCCMPLSSSVIRYSLVAFRLKERSLCLYCAYLRINIDSKISFLFSFATWSILCKSHFVVQISGKFYLVCKIATLHYCANFLYNHTRDISLSSFTPTHLGSIVPHYNPQDIIHGYFTHVPHISRWNVDASTAASPIIKVGTIISSSSPNH